MVVLKSFFDIYIYKKITSVSTVGSRTQNYNQTIQAIHTKSDQSPSTCYRDKSTEKLYFNGVSPMVILQIGSRSSKYNQPVRLSQLYYRH